MKTIIAGSRSISDDNLIWPIIEACPWKITEVVCGMAKGVDLSGKLWAEANSIPVKEFKANWTQHGKAAGPIRNSLMADYAQGLILIWDGESPGSANMLQKATRRSLRVFQQIIVIDPESQLKHVPKPPRWPLDESIG